MALPRTGNVSAGRLKRSMRWNKIHQDGKRNVRGLLQSFTIAEDHMAGAELMYRDCSDNEERTEQQRP